MIRYGSRTIVLALFCLLAMTTAGYGACAWLLWENFAITTWTTSNGVLSGNPENQGSLEWKAAYGTERGCREAQRAKKAVVLKNWQYEKAQAKADVDYYEITVLEGDAAVAAPGVDAISKSVQVLVKETTTPLEGKFEGKWLRLDRTTKETDVVLSWECLPDTRNPRVRTAPQ